MSYDVWLAEVWRLFDDDAKFETLSRLLLEVLYQRNDTPIDAAHWCRIAATV